MTKTLEPQRSCGHIELMDDCDSCVTNKQRAYYRRLYPTRRSAYWHGFVAGSAMTALVALIWRFA